MSANGSGYKVLVIDDSNTIRRSAEIFLKQGGHEVLLAEDGFDALSKVNDHKPHLIFCDILMPRLDGLDVCRFLRMQSTELPILFVTSLEDVRDDAFAAGATDVLAKAADPDPLLLALRNASRSGRLAA